MHLSKAIFAVAFLIAPMYSYSDECVGLLDKKVEAGAIRNLLAAVQQDKTSITTCGSLASVIDKIINRKKTGGRKLEADKPLDQREAQANLNAALKDPEIRARLDKIRSQTKDENARLFYEAAILDEEGYYSARELKIQQLLQRLN